MVLTASVNFIPALVILVMEENSHGKIIVLEPFSSGDTLPLAKSPVKREINLEKTVVSLLLLKIVHTTSETLGGF